jgi:hypothetical protein
MMKNVAAWCCEDIIARKKGIRANNARNIHYFIKLNLSLLCYVYFRVRGFYKKKFKFFDNCQVRIYLNPLSANHFF